MEEHWKDIQGYEGLYAVSDTGIIKININKKMNKDSNDFIMLFLGGIIGILIMVAIQKQLPSAIDVYRGKTTLEITYKDSIPIDSVVVFKDK